MNNKEVQEFLNRKIYAQGYRAINAKTLKEFIEESEEFFEIRRTEEFKNIEDIKSYVEWLDELWQK